MIHSTHKPFSLVKKRKWKEKVNSWDSHHPAAAKITPGEHVQGHVEAWQCLRRHPNGSRVSVKRRVLKAWIRFLFTDGLSNPHLFQRANQSFYIKYSWIPNVLQLCFSFFFVPICTSKITPMWNCHWIFKCRKETMGKGCITNKAYKCHTKD